LRNNVSALAAFHQHSLNALDLARNAAQALSQVLNYFLRKFHQFSFVLRTP
jgi:LPS O-antigen subunit length determinant protein (WzzB/FepE family)